MTAVTRNQIGVAETCFIGLNLLSCALLVAQPVLRLSLIMEELTMEWTTPQHEEICLSCEVSSYANAEL